jgi:ATP-dependent phosphofructokinase / diphosphate-dependent phosphofructokinase
LGGLAGGADLILVPEKSYSVEEILKHTEQRHSSGKDFSLIVISEEIKPPDDLKERYNTSNFTDILFNELSRKSKHEVRKLSLGHLQRGGSPSSVDRIIATLFGIEAVELIKKGEVGKMVSIQNGKIANVDLSSIKERKEVDPEFVRIVSLFY